MGVKVGLSFLPFLPRFLNLDIPVGISGNFVHYEARAPVNRSLLKIATKALTESPIVSLKYLSGRFSFTMENVSRAQ